MTDCGFDHHCARPGRGDRLGDRGCRVPNLFTDVGDAGVAAEREEQNPAECKTPNGEVSSGVMRESEVSGVKGIDLVT